MSGELQNNPSFTELEKRRNFSGNPSSMEYDRVSSEFDSKEFKGVGQRASVLDFNGGKKSKGHKNDPKEPEPAMTPNPEIDNRRVSKIHSKVMHELYLQQGPKEGEAPETLMPSRERTYSMLENEETAAKHREYQQRRASREAPAPFQSASLLREEETAMKRPVTPELSEVFGGLILGLGGQKKKKERPPSPSADYSYRGMIFREGVNLASDFPEGGEMRMTPYCVPNTKRMKEMVRPYTDIAVGFTPGAHISSAMTSKFGKRMSATFLAQRDREEEEGERERAGEEDGEDATDPNVFVFFGKPPKIKPIDCPPMYATTYQLILEYIDEHNLEMLLEHLLALCLISLPDDPFAFMSEHVGKMAEARTDKDKFTELTRIFYPDHIHAMFRVFDKEQTGCMNLTQYSFGMQAMGLVRFTQEPHGYKTNNITEDTFVHEAFQALELLLKSFIS